MKSLTRLQISPQYGFWTPAFAGVTEKGIRRRPLVWKAPMASDLQRWLTEQPPIHPGEILGEEFLKPLNITQYRLAKSIGVDPRRIHAIVHGERAVTAETALLLARFFGNSAQFWMGLQNQYDLETAGNRLAGKLDEVAAYRAAASG